MNKQFVISVIVLFILTMALGMVIHGFLLGESYAALPNLFRPEEEQMGYFLWMVLGHVSMAIGLTWVYRMGKEDKPWLLQGIRFGIAIALLMTVSIYLIYYAVQPMPGELVVKQIVFDGIGVIIIGIVAALANK